MNSGNSLPLVWIVIPTWNRCEDLLACLASVEELDYVNKKVVIVDNASTDGTATAVSNHFLQVDLIPLEKNLGAAAASNVGFDYALPKGADFVLRLDSDTILAPDFLNHLVQAAQKDEKIGIVVGKIYYHADPQRIWSLGARRTSWLYTTTELGRDQFDAPAYEQPVAIDYAWSTGMLLSRRALELTHGFDPDFFVYYEEMDLSQRIREVDLQIWCVPTAVMWHKVGELSRSPWVAYNWARGKMLFFRKHSRGIHRLILILYAYAYALFRFIRPKQGAGNRGPLTAALSGLTAGLRTPLK
jgi:GT2 family glycosyltransferase